MLRVLSLISISVLTNLTSAQNADVKKVLQRFQANRPSAEELAMYRLDWASSFDEAIDRSKKENRPVFLVIIHAKYGDINSGHC